jgi:uncharacterized membrane protein YuzA (DUF378 family)
MALEKKRRSDSTVRRCLSAVQATFLSHRLRARRLLARNAAHFLENPMATGNPDRRVSTHRVLSTFDWIALVLLIVGGLNWALVGLFDFNLVSVLFGPMSYLSRLVYVLVGASALYVLYLGARLNNRY